jgi:hypothetical protein
MSSTVPSFLQAVFDEARRLGLGDAHIAALIEGMRNRF